LMDALPLMEALLLIEALPPIETLPPMPAPPMTFSAPELGDVEATVDRIDTELSATLTVSAKAESGRFTRPKLLEVPDDIAET
ncbi:hypothetical protein, partial [Clostridium perfringens]